jgi:protein-S-isoprenylcysteine O-methyltransferase Ste14
MIQSLQVRIPPPVLMLATGLVMWVLARVSPKFDLPPPVQWLLPVAMGTIAVGIVLSALLAFRRSATTIDPTRPSAATTLVTDGIYRYTRNPMYLGFTGLLLAWALLLGAWWSLPVPLIFGLYITLMQIVPEERALRAKFAGDYVNYSARVRRWF